MNPFPIYTSIFLGSLTLPAFSNLRLVFETDASGTPTTGTFSGPGTVDANIVSGTNGNDIIGAGDGTTIGVKVIDNSTAQNFAPDEMTMVSSFNLGGGTADIGFQQAAEFKGWSVSNFSGASSLTITSAFSDPIHGRTNSTSRLDGYPWGFSTGLLNAGTGFGTTDFDVIYTIGGLQYGTAGDVSSFPTTPIPDYTPRASTGWDNGTTQNTTVFHSADGFLGTTTGSASNNNLLVRGFDDENSSFNGTDAQQFYADTFSISIVPLDSEGNPTTFANDASFVFSYDGDRILNLNVPEPSSVALLALASIPLLSRRNRNI